MFCKNCGRQVSDVAAFCPYCGEKITHTIQEVPEEPVINPEPVVNPAPVVSGNINSDDNIPVYKRKNKAALIVGFIPLIYAIAAAALMVALITLRM